MRKQELKRIYVENVLPSVHILRNIYKKNQSIYERNLLWRFSSSFLVLYDFQCIPIFGRRHMVVFLKIPAEI